MVLLVMNEQGVEKLQSSKFTLGADAAVAGGPVGRSAQAQTDVQMQAKILSYSRSRGLFAGVSLERRMIFRNTFEKKSSAILPRTMNPSTATDACK